MTTQDNRPVSKGAFGQYADWYNAFNRQKNYHAEIDYLAERLAQWRPPPVSWLDIGCGSGEHAAALCARGIKAEGIDVSVDMLASARQSYPQILFHLGAAESFRLDQQFDVASMLFHVASYLTCDDAVSRAMKNIATHLKPNGLFVFDFWHTGGVRHDPPAARVREAVVNKERLFRITNAEQDEAQHLINIRFEFRRGTPSGHVIHEEHHAMRHFSIEELNTFLIGAGLVPLACEGWMTGKPLQSQDWYGIVFAKLAAI
jgi:SAM-dependent methyltransferase